MNKKYTFAIDCDEVLRALLDNMIALYNREFNENLTRDDIKEFKVEKSFPKIEEVTGMKASTWFFQEHSNELFACSPAIPQVQQDIETLKMYGEVYIVTYQKSYQNKIDTLNWLFDNGITYDGICFVKDKSLIRCDFLIDDNDYNIIRGNAKVGILITAPYNKDMNIIDLEYESGCDRVFRFDSLHDFVQDFVHKEDMKAAFEMGMFGPAGMKSIEERILNDNSWAHY